MTIINIQGVKVTITDSMREKMESVMQKVFRRHPPVSHSITVTQDAGGYEVNINYHDDLVQKNVSDTGSDFYAVATAVRDKLLTALSRSHKKKISAKRRPVPSRPVESESSGEEDLDFELGIIEDEVI